jgi:uncharacterized protein (DUF2249 family)/iron-sulfur cluster repair protein YtfE (RIC family)
MDHLVIASTAADAAAASAVEQHHAQLAGSLALKVEGVVAAAANRNDAVAERSRNDLVAWCEQELVPHALAEEKAMYPLAQARPEGRLLVEGMLGEHEVIHDLVAELRTASDPVRAAVSARALQTVFESHLEKENDLVIPLLVAAPDVSLAQVLEGMHELLGHEGHEHGGHEHAEDAPAAESGCGGHSCSCGEVDAPGYPELDARAVPHAIRHATIFGALDAVQPGGGLVLVAPHDPLPLIAQVEQRAPGAFEVDYLERGPEAWRLAFVRSGS